MLKFIAHPLHGIEPAVVAPTMKFRGGPKKLDRGISDSLHWPSDQNLLKEIIADQSAYVSTLSDLRVGIDRLEQ